MDGISELLYIQFMFLVTIAYYLLHWFCILLPLTFRVCITYTYQQYIWNFFLVSVIFFSFYLSLSLSLSLSSFWYYYHRVWLTSRFSHCLRFEINWTTFVSSVWHFRFSAAADMYIIYQKIQRFDICFLRVCSTV
jgi:hypothetical protein